MDGVQCLAVTIGRRILMWLGVSVACLVASYSLVIAALEWFGDYMSEGVLETETPEGNLLVALDSDPPVRQALLSGCHSKGGLSPSVLAVLASGRLAEIPSGTKMQMPAWGDDPSVGTMTIAEGQLKGRQVWACTGQFALLHAWP